MPTYRTGNNAYAIQQFGFGTTGCAANTASAVFVGDAATYGQGTDYPLGGVAELEAMRVLTQPEVETWDPRYAPPPEVPPAAPSHERSAALDATASVTAAGQVTHVHSRSVAIAATGAVAAAGQRRLHRQTALGATATIATAGQVVHFHSRSAAISASAGIASQGIEVLARSAALGATATITSAGLEVLPRTAAFAATASISSSGEVETPTGEFERSAALAASASITSSGEVETGAAEHERSVAISAAGAIASTPQRALQRSAVIDATGFITSVGFAVTVWSRSVALSSVAGIASTGFGFEPGTERVTRIEFDTDTVLDREDTAVDAPERLTGAALSARATSLEPGDAATEAVLNRRTTEVEMGDDATTITLTRSVTELSVQVGTLVMLARSSTGLSLSNGGRTLTPTARSTSLALNRDDTDTLLGEDITTGTLTREETEVT